MLLFNNQPSPDSFQFIVSQDAKQLFYFNQEPNTILTNFETKQIIWYIPELETQSYNKLSAQLLQFLKTNPYNFHLNLDHLPINYKVVINTIMMFTYHPLSYKTTSGHDQKIINLIYQPNPVIEQQIIKNYAQQLSQELSDTPPNIMTPEYFAKNAIEIFKDQPRVKVTILSEQQLREKQMGLILGVAQGSHHPACVVVLELNPANNYEYALIGKGITFDSGGYCLKSGGGQLGMKNDMAGAASVLGVIYGLAQLDSQQSVVAICPMSENLIGEKATLVSTVLHAYNQKTVEVLNTDAEGRLVLADSITLAIQDYHAQKIISIATLTGAICTTLGKYATGAFSTDETLYNKFAEACHQESEKIWQLPVFEENYEFITQGTTIADYCNSPRDSKGASSNAAAFLFNFAHPHPCLHLDIGGTGVTNRDRSTGVMIRSLITFLL